VNDLTKGILRWDDVLDLLLDGLDGRNGDLVLVGDLSVVVTGFDNGTVVGDSTAIPGKEVGGVAWNISKDVLGSSSEQDSLELFGVMSATA